MKKKFTSLKKIFALILCTLVFFTVFKVFKGKSFFDTIVEYQNDIYSENSPIDFLNSENYFAKYEEQIPVKYEEISKIDDGKYVVKNKENVYLYKNKEKEEVLITSLIDPNKSIFEVVANLDWVIWGENITKEDDDKIYYDWTIWAKNINTNKAPIKLDNGKYDKFKKEQRNFNSLMPDNFSIEGNKFVYRKITRSEQKTNNIVSDLVTSELMVYNFNTNKLESIYGLGDVSSEIVSNPKMGTKNVIFEKKSLPDQNGTFKRTEIYNYNLNTKEISKIIEGETILSMDFKGNNVIVLLGNINPSIFVCNLDDNKKNNIIYKGSRAQKYISDENDVYEIYSLKFIDEDNFLINYHVSGGKIGYLIYNIINKKFFSLEKNINEYTESNQYNLSSPLGVSIVNGEFRVYLGAYTLIDKDKNENFNISSDEEDKDKIELMINDEEMETFIDKNEVYYKYLVYKLK